MSGLPTGLPSTLRATTAFALAAGEAIGGRRLRRRRRVLLAQGQLPFQIGDLFLGLRDPLRLLGVLLPESLIFASQPLDVRIRCSPLLRPPFRHSSDGTPIGSSCTAP